MNSSGIKRGLAVSAISALAIAGIPALATPANAESVNDQVGAAGVVLYNSDNAPVTIKSDGTDSTVRLEAGASAEFASVTFQYQLVGSAPVDIATVQRNDDGAFSFDWAPGAGIVGQQVTIRATSTSTAAGNAVDFDEATLVLISNTANGANLTNGSAKGVFDTPYTNGATGTGTGQNVRLTGTASVDGATVNLGYRDGATSRGANTATASIPANSAAGTPASFVGSIDLSGAPGYDFSGVDELVTFANVTGGAEDFEGYTLYNQVITTVTAAADRLNVAVNDADQTATVTVTVVDQNGAPIVGAEVRSSAGGAARYTDANGQATFDQAPSSAFYYANATDNDPFVAAEGDKRSNDLVVNGYSPVISSLVATSADGAAFDRDEYAGNEITVQAKDQTGANIDVPEGQDLSYFFVLTPFDGSPATVRFPTTGNSTVTTDANGQFVVPLPTGAAAESGTYELFAGLTDDSTTAADETRAPSSVLTVKVGQASIRFAPATTQSAPAGGQVDVTGTLVLEDGTVLAGRSVDVTYARGTAGTDTTKDAGIVPATAGGALVLSRTFTTGANGAFTLTVDDPAETPQGTELGGQLRAVQTTTGAFSGTATGADAGDLTVDFVSTTAPAGTTVVITDIGGAPSPGEVVTGTATITAPDGTFGAADGTRDNVAGQQVTLALPAGSGAYFTDGTPAATPVIGADAGTFNNLGKTITLTSDANGLVTFRLSIGRDTGFDDDGLVEAIVTATAGTGATAPSDTEDIDFDSSTPINGGTVEIVKSPASEQEGGTTPADPFQDVSFDVYTTDQFGNRVGGETVNVTATGADDDTVETVVAQGGGAITSDFAADGDFSVRADQADTVTVRATWQTETTKYTTAGGTGSPVTTTVANGETLTDTETFMVANTPNTATLTGSPEDTAPVNTAVTETFTLLDDEGNPVAGQGVTFTRVGPNGQTETVTRTTNANGVAQYVFTGTAAGTVTITAEANDANATSATDTVTFTATPPQEPVTFVISSNPETGVNVGDTVVETVTVEDGDGNGFAGATVEFTRSDTGATVTRTTNAAGQASFTVSRSTSGAVNITAVVDYGTGTTTLNDRIVFAKTKINVNTTVGNANGGRTDIIRINVTGENEANGATATLFKRVNGRNVRLTSKTVNANGQAEFRVRDLNKRQLTLYFVRVSPTADTLGATGPVKKVR